MKHSRRQFWGVEPMRRSIVCSRVLDRHSAYQSAGAASVGGGGFCSVVLRAQLGLVALRARRGLWWRLVGWVAELGCLASSCCFVSLRVVSLVRLCLAGGLVGWVGGRRLVAAASRGGGVSQRRLLAAVSRVCCGPRRRCSSR